MKEEVVDLWSVICDARVVTTNGTVRRDGKAVMGRGCAREAVDLDPGVAARLGHSLFIGGNHVHVISETAENKPLLLSFPVKHHWRQQADLKLIEQSAHELVHAANTFDLKTVVLPRPGCGNGRLSWDDVKPVIAPILDDRFTVVHK